MDKCYFCGKPVGESFHVRKIIVPILNSEDEEKIITCRKYTLVIKAIAGGKSYEDNA